MALSDAKAARAARRGDLDTSPLPDNRDSRGVRHPQPGLVNLTVAALAAGAKNPRQIEQFSVRLSRRARKKLGLTRHKVSDTAVWEWTVGLDPDGFPQVVVKQVKAQQRAKVVRNDAFPAGVVSIDGKTAWTGEHDAHELARKSKFRKDGPPFWRLDRLDACLVSSMVRPCLGMRFIPKGRGEATEFGAFFMTLADYYGTSFEVAFADAGNTSRHNARVVLQRGKSYVFGLKKNQRRLYDLALARLQGRPTEAQTVDHYRGKVITRQLSRATLAADDREVKFHGALQFLRVLQTTVEADGKTSTEDRLFVTSIPAARFSAEQLLRLVRLHWQVENGVHWTLDVVFGEDDGTFCTRGEGVVVTTWLRALAYNVLAAWRAKEPKVDGKPPTWVLVMKDLWTAFATADVLRLHPQANEG